MAERYNKYSSQSNCGMELVDVIRLQPLKVSVTFLLEDVAV